MNNLSELFGTTGASASEALEAARREQANLQSDAVQLSWLDPLVDAAADLETEADGFITLKPFSGASFVLDTAKVTSGQVVGYPDNNPKTAMGMKKPDLTVVPPVALLHLATAMMNGAVKYGPFNWRDAPISTRPYIAAALRHILSFLDGEDFSADTVEAGAPVHHLAHVMACCAIVLDAISVGTISDNRPAVPGQTGEMIEHFNKTGALTPQAAEASKAA